MAIKKAAEMDFSNKKFMVIISGQPGLGKTTLALSAPKPFLFDTDNGIARVKAAHRQEVVTSVTESYEELLGDMESEEYKAAQSIIIDTGGTLVQLMKSWAIKQDKKAKDGRAMYGVIKTEFDRLCYQIRKDGKHLIVVFHTTEQSKGDVIQTRLSCEGSTKDIVWTPADFGGHMYMMGSKRVIGFTPTDEYFAKGCFGVQGVIPVPDLKDGQKNTFLADLFAKAQENINAEAAVYGGEKKAYDAALEQGKAIIETANDPASVAAAADAISNLDHALTSKAELKKLLLARMKEIGVKWDAKEKAYVAES